MNENLHPHQYCQSVLRFLYVNRLDTQNNSKWVMTRLKLQFPDIGEYIFEDVIAVLFNDGFLETDRGVLPKLHPFYMIYFTISDKGIAFYFTDTYENRRKREQLQLDLLESQIEVHKSTLITNANIISTNKNTEITNGILKSIFRMKLFILLYIVIFIKLFYIYYFILF